MVEQLICNQQVAGSIPIASSNSFGIAWSFILYFYMVGRKAEAPKSRGEVPERSKGADCKSAGSAFGGSNPPLSTIDDNNFSRR